MGKVLATVLVGSIPILVWWSRGRQKQSYCRERGSNPYTSPFWNQSPRYAILKKEVYWRYPASTLWMKAIILRMLATLLIVNDYFGRYEALSKQISKLMEWINAVNCILAKPMHVSRSFTHLDKLPVYLRHSYSISYMHTIKFTLI